MIDRLSIFGPRDGVSIVRVESSRGASFDDLMDNTEYIREELVIARHAIENVIGEDYATDIEDVELDIEPDHDIRK